MGGISVLTQLRGIALTFVYIKKNLNFSGLGFTVPFNMLLAI